MVYSKICEICGDSYKTTVSKRRTCGKSCGSKLIRKEQGERNRKPCASCGDLYEPRNQVSLFCLKPILRICLGCLSSFQAFCGQEKPRYCSTSCRNKTMRRENYKIKERRYCVVCNKLFQPTTSRQKICMGKHEISCEFCGEKFEPGHKELLSDPLGKFCGNSCSSLFQMKSLLTKEHLVDYKDPDSWARRFRISHKRKPTKNDFFETIGVGLPSGADETLFSKRKISGWETRVILYLETQYPTLLIRNRRRILDFCNGTPKKEIDVFLPSLSLGFEVQDFATHSRTSDNEETENILWRGRSPLKKGPLYHERKREAALRQGVVLIDIWEDEIINGVFRDKVDESVDRMIAKQKESGNSWLK